MPERRVLYEPKDDLRAWLAAVAQPGLRPSMSDGRRADAGASVLTACAVACSPVDALPADPDRVEAGRRMSTVVDAVTTSACPVMGSRCGWPPRTWAMRSTTLGLVAVTSQVARVRGRWPSRAPC